MTTDDLPQSIRNHLLPFLKEYKDSVAAYTTNALAGIAWIASSAFGQPSLMYLAIGLHTVPASVYYAHNRPYGLTIDVTPTVGNGEGREPDKIAEQNGEATIRNRRGTLHAAVDISDYRDCFALVVDIPSEIRAEFRTKPRREHNIERDPLTLIGEDISDREFQLVIELFLLDSDTPESDRYQMALLDGHSDRTIEEIKLVPR